MTAPVAHSESVPESLTRLVMSHLREIPDFPEPGVLFRDRSEEHTSELQSHA